MMILMDEDVRPACGLGKKPLGRRRTPREATRGAGKLRLVSRQIEGDSETQVDSDPPSIKLRL